MREKISVALCSYNGSKFIADQLNSILNQTQKPDEIVICDDKSSDDTVQIAKDILEKSNLEYKVEVNESNLGVIKNFEKAIVMCSGDIIFTSDQDDVWVDSKVKQMVELLSSDRNLLLAFSDAYLTDHQMNVNSYKLWEAVNPKVCKLDSKEDYLDLIIKGNFVTGATMAFRRNLLSYALPFNDLWIHDYWLAINAALLGGIVGTDRALIYYRQHDKNVIGMKRLSLQERLGIYINNFKRVEHIRNDNYERCCVLLYHIKKKKEVFNDQSELVIQNAVDFWSELLTLKSNKLLDGLRIIINRLLHGDYCLYYTGFRGAFRDIVYMFIRNICLDNNI